MRSGPELTHCSNRDKHTEGPEAYQGWHMWAMNKAKTHNQIRCNGCGLFAVWIPKVSITEVTE